MSNSNHSPYRKDVASIAALAGRTAGTCVRWARRHLGTNCSCEGLQRLIIELPQLAEVDQKLAAIDRAFSASLRMRLVIFTPSRTGLGVTYHSERFVPDQVDHEHASRAFEKCSTASRSRSRDLKTMYLPLLTALTTGKTCVGVLAFTGWDSDTSKKWPIIQAFANQTALVLLRSDLEDEARYAHALRDKDRFQKTLLDSIAHNVRTPLASIIGALSTLQEDAAMLDAPVRRELIDTARQEADRLNRLLGNLLDLSRLESGVVRVRSDHCDVQDVIGAALEQLRPALRDWDIQVAVDPNLPTVEMDFVLIAQVIVNLLDNALKYSPQGAPISIEARQSSGAVTIVVSDEGEGIPGDNPQRAFQKFDRAGRSGEIAGLGLGLSICKCFVEAHRGSMRLERRNPRGTRIEFTLPLKAQPQEARTP